MITNIEYKYDCGVKEFKLLNCKILMDLDKDEEKKIVTVIAFGAKSKVLTPMCIGSDVTGAHICTNAGVVCGYK